jgi:hypothetical protein
MIAVLSEPSLTLRACLCVKVGRFGKNSAFVKAG